MATPLEAVIFDVDGTLVDSERDGHRVAFNEAFTEAGLPDRWDVGTYGDLLAIAGGRQRLAHWFEQHGKSPDEADALARQLHPRKTEIMTELVKSGRIAARPGIVELLDLLSEHGVAIHVATTGTRAWVDPLLSTVFGARFKTIVTGTEIPDLKPDPAAYLAVMRLTGCSPETTVAVEGSPNGVRAAIAAGLPVIAAYHPSTGNGDLPGSVLIADGPDDPELVAWFRARMPAKTGGA